MSFFTKAAVINASAQIADGVITNSKLAAGAVTYDKMTSVINHAHSTSNSDGNTLSDSTTVNNRKLEEYMLINARDSV